MYLWLDHARCNAKRPQPVKLSDHCKLTCMMHLTSYLYSVGETITDCSQLGWYWAESTVTEILLTKRSGVLDGPI